MREFSLDRLGEMLADSPPTTFWRHDVDVSPTAAVQMAELEADLGIVATFYVMTESPFYTPMDAVLLAIRLSALGHRVGWHIDCDRPVTDEMLRGRPVSFHCPTEFVLWRDFPMFENAYASRWMGRYLADSRGGFADGDPEDRFDGEPLQVNLHPEWWFDRDSISRMCEVAYKRFFREPKSELLACA